MATESAIPLGPPFYWKDYVDSEGKRVIARTKSLRFVCCVCRKQFSTKIACVEHLNSAHGVQVQEIKLTDSCKLDSPSNCPFCSKTFSNRRNMIRHMRHSHPGNLPGEIAVAPKPRPTVIDNHWKREACPVCNKSYSRISAVNRHILRRHSRLLENDQLDTISCHFCDLRFPDENSCADHMSNYHHAIVITESESGETKLLLNCTLCEEQFTIQSDFKQHLAGAHGEKLKEFAVEVMSETEEVGEQGANFNCDECNVSFTSEITWRCHMKEDHAVFPESCCQRCGDCSLKTVQELKCHLQDVHSINSTDKGTKTKFTISRELRAEGRNIGLSAPELRALEKIPDWLVKHGDGKLLLVVYK